MKKKNGHKPQHFLQRTEGTESFHEIAIIREDNDLQEFEAKKQRVLDDVLKKCLHPSSEAMR